MATDIRPAVSGAAGLKYNRDAAHSIKAANRDKSKDYRCTEYIKVNCIQTPKIYKFRRKRKKILTAVIAIVLITIAGIISINNKVRGETFQKTLSKNYNFWVELGDLVEDEVVEYKLKVNGTNRVDVLWMTYAEWKRYNATSPFTYDSSRSELNITEVTRKVSVPSDNNYILVVDNTEVPEGGAKPEGEVTFTFDVNIYKKDDSCCLFGILSPAAMFNFLKLG
ncbi:MAG: hypothetical protein QW728_03795 [Thermoplasmata archaeon]